MPTKSFPERTVCPPTVSARTAAAQKSAATVLRNKAEIRAEALRQIDVQAANGTLTIRQMTVAQLTVATEDARRTRLRNETRPKSYTPADRVVA